MAMVSPKLNTKHVCRRSFAFFLSGLSYIFKECCFEMKSFKKKIHLVLCFGMCEINCLGTSVFCGLFVCLKFIL